MSDKASILPNEKNPFLGFICESFNR